jgi:hypothetical protein
MVAAIYLGCVAFILHAVTLARGSLRLILTKMALLLLYFVVLNLLLRWEANKAHSLDGAERWRLQLAGPWRAASDARR